MNPFMALPYDAQQQASMTMMMQEQQNYYFTEEIIEPEIQMDSAEKSLIIDKCEYDRIEQQWVDDDNHDGAQQEENREEAELVVENAAI